jgi:hypothetical protein
MVGGGCLSLKKDKMISNLQWKEYIFFSHIERDTQFNRWTIMDMIEWRDCHNYVSEWMMWPPVAYPRYWRTLELEPALKIRDGLPPCRPENSFYCIFKSYWACVLTFSASYDSTKISTTVTYPLTYPSVENLDFLNVINTLINSTTLYFCDPLHTIKSYSLAMHGVHVDRSSYLSHSLRLISKWGTH